MKKILNDVDRVEEEMIQGLVKSAPKMLRKLDYGTIVVRADKKEGKVALVSGGGSGHEPAHAGYVGTGMLDGAVAGTVFTSPTPDQVLEGIKAVATDQGVLCVVKNYTGDIMNFEMAVEMAADEDIKADYVVVNDDVAVRDSLYTTGRRGVAGTIFVHKIAGAKAEQGASLADVKSVAERSLPMSVPWGWPLNPAPFRPQGNRALNWPKTKWKSGSASMANRGLTGKSCVRLMTSPRCSSMRFWPTSTIKDTMSSSWSMAWAAHR